MNILLVDDSEPFREPIHIHLRTSGHQVTTAGDGLEALEIMADRNFDLIVTDIRMPRIDGLELLRRVKAADPRQDVMMITGYGDMDSSVEALRLGATNYLVKPINLEELGLAVEAVAERQRLARVYHEQEIRLAHARKMAELGMVIGGVTHEINNPNTYIRGNIQTLQRFWPVFQEYIQKAKDQGVETPEKLDYMATEIPRILTGMLDGTDRIRKIINGVSAFTKAGAGDNLQGVDLDACVKQAVDQLADAAGDANIQLNLASPPPVLGTPDGITEVIQELLANSLRAVQNRQAPEVRIETSVLNDRAALLAVSDNGGGIPSEDREQVFTPFFTTDPRIGRPGLGLSKAYAVVRGFGGALELDPETTVGARFTVTIPFTEERDHLG
jgi:signal transduction histidine kinase